jgi:hypothetical protein
MPDLLSIALKEWDLQISAMLAGRQAFLLRKGGILEAENEFQMEHPRFLFFPTVIHQDPKMVKPEFRPGLRTEREEPGEVTLRAYGEVVKIFEIPPAPLSTPGTPNPGRKALESLSDLYIWDAPLLDMRFAYRPEKPLYVAVVRAYALPAPVTVANTLAYAGCKSWVPLDVEIDVANATPALSDDAISKIVERVGKALATH